MNFLAPSSGIANGLSTIVVGLYIGSVIWNGNLRELQHELLQDSGFLEIVVGLFIIYQLMQFPPTSELAMWLFGMAVLATVLRAASGGFFSNAAFGQFFRGEIGLTEFAAKILNQQAITE